MHFGLVQEVFRTNEQIFNITETRVKNSKAFFLSRYKTSTYQKALEPILFPKLEAVLNYIILCTQDLDPRCRGLSGLPQFPHALHRRQDDL